MCPPARMRSHSYANPRGGVVRPKLLPCIHLPRLCHPADGLRTSARLFINPCACLSFGLERPFIVPVKVLCAVHVNNVPNLIEDRLGAIMGLNARYAFDPVRLFP